MRIKFIRSSKWRDLEAEVDGEVVTVEEVEIIKRVGVLIITFMSRRTGRQEEVVCKVLEGSAYALQA